MLLTYHLRELFSKNLFFKNVFLVSSVGLSFLIHGLFWYFTITIFLPKVRLLEQPQIPLHYTIYFNVDYYGDYRYIYLLGVVGLIIGFINVSLAILFYKRERVLSFFLILSGLFFQMGLAWYLYLILRFNAYI